VTRLDKLATVCTGTLFLYYEVYRWVPLGKWNWQFKFPVINDQFYPDLIIGLLLIWFAWSFATRRTVGMWTAAALLTLWVVIHLFDWWIPYARSLPQNIGRYHFYQQRTQVLPALGHHYPPDGGHAVLDFILFPTCLIAVLATIRDLPSRNAGHLDD
jgi:hypothetical protein